MDDDVDGDHPDRTGWARFPRREGGVGVHPEVSIASGSAVGLPPSERLDSAAQQDYSGGMRDRLPEDSNAALAWMWGQYVWVPLTWRIDRRWGLPSVIARAMNLAGGSRAEHRG